MLQYSKMKVVLILLQLAIAFSASLNVSVLYPFVLTSPPLNITTLDLDLQNSFLVGLADGQARRYSADFSSYSSLVVPEVVDKFSSSSFSLPFIMLTNFTIWNMLGNMTATLSNSRTTLRTYSYPAFLPLTALTFPDPILNYYGVPLHSPPNLTPLHLLTFGKAIKAVYRNVIHTVFDLTTIFGSGKLCTTANITTQSHSAFFDFLYLSVGYLQAVSGVGLVTVTISFTFTYNFTSLAYDFSFTSTHQVAKSFADVVTSMLMANGLTLMQLQNGSLMTYGNNQVSNAFTDVQFSASNPILSLIYDNSSYYVLHSSGLAKVQVNTMSMAYQGSTSVAMLPNNSYRYVVGSLLNVLYVPLTPQIYKGVCQGQSSSNGKGGCSSYNCTDSNCLQCPLSPSTCGVCASGFVRDSNLRCSPAPLDPAVIPTAIPTAIPTVLPTVLPTAIPSAIPTVLPGAINGSGSNMQPQSAVYFSLDLGLLDIFWAFFNASMEVISVPAMRRLVPIFYYFGNFDDLQLYLYHDRIYGTVMQELFTKVNQIQRQKWDLFTETLDLRQVNTENQTLHSIADFQGEYLTYSYSFPGRQSEGSEGLLTNCGNFIIFGVPLTFAAFLLLRCCFKALFRRPCSRLLRKFDFWGYFLVLIFEGNVQQFAFCLAAEWRHAATFALWQRGVKAAVFLFGFVVVAAAVGGAFVLFAAYGRLNRHLAENNRNTLRGNAFLLLQSGVRNLILGVLHSALRPLPYATMISILLCTEAAFCAAFVAAVPLGAYRALHCVWAFLWLSLVRMLLISTLFFDYADVGNTLIETVQCALIIAMLLLYIIVTVVAVLTTIRQLFRTIKKIMQSQTYKKPASERNKITLQTPTIPVVHKSDVPPKKALSLDLKQQKHIEHMKVMTIFNNTKKRWNVVHFVS